MGQAQITGDVEICSILGRAVLAASRGMGTPNTPPPPAPVACGRVMRTLSASDAAGLLTATSKNNNYYYIFPELRCRLPLRWRSGDRRSCAGAGACGGNASCWRRCVDACGSMDRRLGFEGPQDTMGRIAEHLDNETGIADPSTWSQTSASDVEIRFMLAPPVVALPTWPMS